MLPSDIGDDYRIDHYTMQIIRRVGAEYNIIINTGSVQPPLPDHTSFLLDFEVFQELRSPVSDSKLWERLGEMRHLKNHMFESLITEKARGLMG